MSPIKIGIIGFGRMGGFYLEQMRKSGDWEVAYICDVCEQSREEARKLAPEAKVIADEQIIFVIRGGCGRSLRAGRFAAVADRQGLRRGQARHCREAHRRQRGARMGGGRSGRAHAGVFDGQPLPAQFVVSQYDQGVRRIGRNRRVGDHPRLPHDARLAPGEGHEYEGPAFHDCGMHYVDIARWYAESEFKTWNAQAVRMWNYKDPWWLQCHGTFENGVVFDITQGHVYGQLI